MISSSSAYFQGEDPTFDLLLHYSYVTIRLGIFWVLIVCLGFSGTCNHDPKCLPTTGLKKQLSLSSLQIYTYLLKLTFTLIGCVLIFYLYFLGLTYWKICATHGIWSKGECCPVICTEAIYLAVPVVRQQWQGIQTCHCFCHTVVNGGGTVGFRSQYY